MLTVKHNSKNCSRTGGKASYCKQKQLDNKEKRRDWPRIYKFDFHLLANTKMGNCIQNSSNEN